MHFKFSFTPNQAAASAVGNVFFINTVSVSLIGKRSITLLRCEQCSIQTVVMTGDQSSKEVSFCRQTGRELLVVFISQHYSDSLIK